MSSGHRAVELVIETASGLLTGRFGPREAVTILASQGPQARAQALVLAEREPDWSRAHAELLGAIRAALATKTELGAQARELRAVLEDLDRVAAALTT